MQQQELSRHIADLFQTHGEHKEVFTIAITGFPTCGKSTIAAQVVDLFPSLTIIEAEFWIKNLEARMLLDVSGTSLQAYEAAKALDDIRSIRRGFNIEVQRYSHAEKIRINPFTQSAGTGLILDGCIFADTMFRSVIDYHVCIVPADLDEWLKNTIYRDVQERYFSADFSLKHTKRKFYDLKDMLLQEGFTPDELYICNGNITGSNPVLYYEEADQDQLVMFIDDGI